MLNPDERREGHNHAGRDDMQNHQADTRHSDRRVSERRMSDREVPLGGLTAADDAGLLAVHQWLDGDLPEADARTADARQVDLWNRISEETTRRSRMTTPTHVAANIMNALPAAAPAFTAATAATAANMSLDAAVAPSVARDTMIAPATPRAGVSFMGAVLVGGFLFAVGVAIGKLLQ